MSRVKVPLTQSKRLTSQREMTLTEALSRINDPRTAESLSVFYAHLARAQMEADQDAINYIRESIAEALRGVPVEDIDQPLLPLRKRARRRRP